MATQTVKGTHYKGQPAGKQQLPAGVRFLMAVRPKAAPFFRLSGGISILPRRFVGKGSGFPAVNRDAVGNVPPVRFVGGGGAGDHSAVIDHNAGGAAVQIAGL